MRTIPVIHCFDRNYVLPAAVCFHSLLEHAVSPSVRYAIHVVGKGFTEDDIALLENVVSKFPNASIGFREPEDFGFGEFDFSSRNHFTSDLFNKLTIPSLFPEYDKVVVADVDVVYEGDVAEAFDSLDVSGPHLLAGVWDVCYATWHKKGLFPTGEIAIKRYGRKFTAEEREKLVIGAGLVVYNSKALREENTEKKWIGFLNENKSRLTLPEQEAYNLVCAGRIKTLPLGFMSVAAFLPDYAKMDSEKRKENPAWDEMYSRRMQFHYASAMKPWKYPGAPGAEIWFDACIRAGLFHLWREWYGNYSKEFNGFPAAKKLLDIAVKTRKKVYRLTLSKGKIK